MTYENIEIGMEVYFKGEKVKVRKKTRRGEGTRPLISILFSNGMMANVHPRELSILLKG